MLEFFLKTLRGLKSPIFLILSSFFTLSACTVDSSSSSTVEVIVSPFGRGDKVISTRPVIYLHSSERGGICRPRPYRVREARNILTKENMTKDFLDEFFPLEDRAEAPQGTAEGNRDNDPVYWDIGDNWLKFGLIIKNPTVEVKGQEDRNFFLIIETIFYSAVGLYKGERFGPVTGTLSAGDCGGGEAGPPFLYFIPSNKSVLYQPHSANPFNNLTLYIDGLEIIDRSEEESPRLKRLGAGSAEGGGGAQAGSEEDFYGPNEIIVIPDYTVELTLRGYFMNNEGTPIREFVQRKTFQTQGAL